MDAQDAVELARHAMLMALLISAPVLAAGMVVGLVIGLLQALTQIQEQTLTFVPKMLIIFGVLAALGPWFGTTMLKFTQMCFGMFPQYFP